MPKLLFTLTLLFCPVFIHGINVAPSWTLPVIEINTKGGDSIKTKDYYIPATFRLYENKDENPEIYNISIKGRGNSTWKYFEKKPYKIKFEKKINLTGGGKSKHYALINFCDNEYAYWDNLVGFELSRRIGMAWTPSMKAVELILNGDYQGLYFIVETIRIENNRVDIKEQENGEENNEIITGGWLLEINNYYEDNQIYFTDNDNNTLKISYHNPDSLSTSQFDYIYGLLKKTNESINSININNREWEKYIDCEELAKFYIIQECIDNPEGFRGSCWIYKDRGVDSKLKFGPVWDLGAGNYWRNEPRFITDGFVVLDHKYKQFWITEILSSSPQFYNTLINIWNELRDKIDILDLVNSSFKEIENAVNNDHLRWPQYDYTFTYESCENFLKCYKMKTDFLDSKWHFANSVNTIVNSEPQVHIYSGTLEISCVTSDINNVSVTTLNGSIRHLHRIGNNRYSLKEIPKGVACLVFYLGQKKYKKMIIVK